MSTQHTNDRRTEPEISRRKLLKTTGAGAGALAVGATGAGPVPKLVQEGRAVAPVIIFGAGAAAGLIAGTVGGYLISSDNKTNADEIVREGKQKTIYEVATALYDSQERANLRQSLREDHVKPVPGETTFADAAWSSAKKAAARTYEKTGNKTKAENAALDAIDKQYTRALYSAINIWNGVLVGADSGGTLMEQVTSAQTIGSNQFDFTNSAKSVGAVSPGDLSYPSGTFSAVEGYETLDSYPDGSKTGEYTLYKTEWNGTPYPLSEIDNIDDKVVIYYIPNNSGTLHGPADSNNVALPESLPIGIWSNGPDNLTVDAPDRDEKPAVNMSLMSEYFIALKESYEQAKNEIPVYVEENIVPAVKDGDFLNFIDGTDLLDEFSGANDSARSAAEALSGGYKPPKDMGTKVKISHPDLSTDRWGNLYVRFVDGSDTTLSEGTTISPSDYNGALFGYTTESGGEYTTTRLSGESPLEILKTEGDGGVEYDDRDVGRPPDPAQASPDDVEESRDAWKDWRDGIDEDLSGGGLFGGGLGDVLGGAKDLIVLGGIALLALVGLNAASG